MTTRPATPLAALPGRSPSNPRRAAFWALVRQHGKPVDWQTIAPARPVLNPPSR